MNEVVNEPKRPEINKELWPALHSEMRPIKDLIPYPNNTRTHPPEQIEMLAGMMQRYGVDQPIVVDEDNVILKGHGRRLAAIAAGFDVFPVATHHGLSDHEKRAMRIEDNKSALMAGWDQGLMKLEVGSLIMAGYDVSLLGFDSYELDAFMSPPLEGVSEPPQLPLPTEPRTKLGDIWQLGPHRIMCGDARDPASVAKLLDGAAINIGFTSPPYAEQREYDQTSGFKPIPPDEYVGWFKAVADSVAAHLASDGSWFVNIKPNVTPDDMDTELYVFDLVIAHRRAWGWHYVTEFCWERVGMPRAVARRFKNQFEPIYQFARGVWKMRPEGVQHASDNVPIPAGPGVGATTWSKFQGQGAKEPFFGSGRKKKQQTLVKGPLADVQGDDDKRKPVTLGKGQAYPGNRISLRGINWKGVHGTNWQSETGPIGIPREEIGPGMAYPGNRLPTFTASHDAVGHAAAFPVGLPAFFIRAYSDVGDAIYDPFLGSGSTLLAAHQLERIGYGMELSPAYVDLAIQRWENLAGGEKAVLLTVPSAA